MQSIRVKLESEVLEKIDRVAGRGGRQRFIREAILWRLEQDIPPLVLELEKQIGRLEERVSALENLHSTDVFLSGIKDVVLKNVCRDKLDREILGYFIRHGGSTTPELAEALLGNRSKRRTILDRIDGLNTRAKQFLGVPILTLEKGTVRGKRGAWWLTNTDYLQR